jgi:hypothetical protein
VDGSRGRGIVPRLCQGSLDSVVGSNQTSASLEARVGAEFQRMMPDAVTGLARVVWSALSCRSVVRRFKVVNAACLKNRSKRRTVVAARLSGCSVDDVERVSLMLYNDKGTLANASRRRTLLAVKYTTRHSKSALELFLCVSLPTPTVHS